MVDIREARKGPVVNTNSLIGKEVILGEGAVTGTVAAVSGPTTLERARGVTGVVHLKDAEGQPVNTGPNPSYDIRPGDNIVVVPASSSTHSSKT